MSDDTITMIRASDLLPGDMVDFEGDPIVDPPDHCMICGGLAEWTEATGWRHVEAGQAHEVLEVPRDAALDFEFEYVQVYRVYTPDSFHEGDRTGEHDFPLAFAPWPGTVAIWTTSDDWIILPVDHEVKVDERRGPEDVE